VRKRAAEGWTNWCRNVTAAPSEVVHPENVEQLAQLITAASQGGRPVKPVGAGHSFNSIAAADGVQICLDRLTGLSHVDHSAGLVTVRGGTTLAELNVLLAAEGLALENLGDIDRQTITGAISTGTHGTGARFGGLAAQVRQLMIITADGAQLRCSETEHPDIYAASRIGLGALGVITEVTLQCMPAFGLHAIEGPSRLDEILEGFDAMITENDHVDIHWFPHTDRTLTKRNNRVPQDQVGNPLPRWRYLLDDEILSNALWEGLNRLAWLRPSLVPRSTRFRRGAWRRGSSPIPLTRYSLRPDASGSKSASTRSLAKRWCQCCGHFDDHDERISIPVQIRVAAADDIWLSTAHQRETGYIAVHHYFKIDHRRYFAAFESIVAEHQGRPHWGKLHTLKTDQLRTLYPRFDHFIRIRDRVDPGRTFDNAYLRSVIGS
jgi:L-gulono-1,4-lactone dehydrogenase